MQKPNAEYFDGASAHSHLACVTLTENMLVIERQGHPPVQWRLSELELVAGGKRGQALRLKQTGNHGSRLTLPEGPLADSIVESERHIRLGHWNRFVKGASVAVGVVILLAGLTWLTLAYAPSLFAGMLPDRVVNTFADGLEKTVIKSSKRCENPAGVAALNTMMRRVLTGTSSPPTFSLRVFDIRQSGNKKLVNAFALPGGRMVISAGLIENAQSPDEVAGVLAHELGHVALKHPEAAIVRVYGLQMLLSVFTAGQGAETLSNIAGVVAVLRYSRSAEAEADEYAREVMRKASIDPAGLRAFFTRLMNRNPLAKPDAGKDGGTTSSSNNTPFGDRFKNLTDMFSTHPGTQSRIESLEPLPGGSAPQVLTPAQWAALKNICN